MNGARSLVQTLLDHGVDTCFMNPGTSEMHFVAALDDEPDMHGVLALFEGVATGAADGYARIRGGAAATLLHLGPGLGNGLANLHNARRAHSPVVNIVGDHALPHRRYDAQLQSDIATVARNVSPFVRTTEFTESVGIDARDALAAAYGPPGSVATLILPADVSWSEGGVPVRASGTEWVPAPASGTVPDADVVEAAAAALRSGRALRRLHRRSGVLRAPCSTPWPTWPHPSGPSCCARRSRPAWPGAPAGRPSSAWATSPSSP